MIRSVLPSAGLWVDEARGDQAEWGEDAEQSGEAE
jgi:hypothetical protein